MFFVRREALNLFEQLRPLGGPVPDSWCIPAGFYIQPTKFFIIEKKPNTDF